MPTISSRGKEIPASPIRHKCKQHCFRSACGDNYIVDIYIDIERLIIRPQFLTQRKQALRRTVFQNGAVYAPESVQDGGEHLDSLMSFIERQQIVLDIRSGNSSGALEKLRKMLEENPDNDFALRWLARLS